MESIRLREMLEMYGELCTQETAAKIICTSTRTIRRMTLDGRLRTVNHRIDVRSIAEYIDHPYKPNRKPKKHDFYAASFRR